MRDCNCLETDCGKRKIKAGKWLLSVVLYGQDGQSKAST